MKNKINNKLSVFFKVLIMHLFILFLLDINFSKILGNENKKIEIGNQVKFVNLKSISLEEIEKSREKIKLKKKKLEDLKKKETWGSKKKETCARKEKETCVRKEKKTWRRKKE